MRAHFVDHIIDKRTGDPLAGATVYIKQQGTDTDITENIYQYDDSHASAATTLSNPLTSAADGKVEFYLTDEKRVDLKISYSGLTTYTRTEDVLKSASTGSLTVMDSGVAAGIRTVLNLDDPAFVVADDAGNARINVTLTGLATDAELATHAAAADPHTVYILESLLDAKGDLIAASAADTPAKVTVGANDTILIADSTATPGVKWGVRIERTVLSGFVEQNLAASATADQMSRNVAASSPSLPIVMTHAGHIIGVSVASAEARSAGTATFEVYKNGVATGLTCVLNGTDTTYAFGVQAVALDTFVAGDRLDVRNTTSADWAPTTAEVEAAITVQYS